MAGKIGGLVVLNSRGACDFLLYTDADPPDIHPIGVIEKFGANRSKLGVRLEVENPLSRRRLGVDLPRFP